MVPKNIVYLDVSASVVCTPYGTTLVELAERLRWSPFWEVNAFDHEHVHEVWDMQTGGAGAELDPVAAHMEEKGHEKAYVLTDGYIHVPKHCAPRLNLVLPLPLLKSFKDAVITEATVIGVPEFRDKFGL